MRRTAAFDIGALATAGLTALLWGLTGVFVRLLPSLPPLTLTALRLAIALVVLLPMLGIAPTMRRALGVVAKQASAYALASLLVGYYLLATAAFQLAPVAEVAVLLSTSPVFVLSIRRLRGEPVRRRQAAGALLALSGIAIVVAPSRSPGAAPTGARLAGDGLAACAAALTAVYATYFNALAQRGRAPDSVALSVLTLAVGVIVAGSAAALLEPQAAVGPWETKIALLLGLGVLCTAVPTIGFAVASRRLAAVVTACISLSIPIFAALFAQWLLGEALSVLFVPGLAFALAGMAMIAVPGRQRSIA
jgi:drug/metabolite transporter (DMT)-like permease